MNQTVDRLIDALAEQNLIIAQLRHSLKQYQQFLEAELKDLQQWLKSVSTHYRMPKI